MRYLPVIVMVMGILAVALLGAGRTKKTLDVSGKLSVTASFYPLYFFAGEIGGDHADVVNIIPAGVEPHEYELAPQDIVRIEQSRILILNGGDFEPWAADMRRSIDPEKTLIVEAGAGLATRQSQMQEDSNIVIDPHIWLNPKLAEKMADAILQGFIAVDSTNRMGYETNAAVLKEGFVNLNREYREGLAHCARRDFITSHAAFGYLAAEYGLNQVSIAGLSPEQEPSPATLASVVRFAREHDIRYIFFETMVSPRLAETIAREIGAKTLVLDPIEGLGGDEISAGENYFTKMRANLTNLKLALACTP